MTKAPGAPTIGLVVGSGGIKTLAAVEMFRFLQAQQLPIDLLIGCSGGGIIAALAGCGYTTDEIVAAVTRFWNRNIFRRIDLRTLLGILQLPLGRFDKGHALLVPTRMQRTLRTFFGPRRLEDLPIRTLIHTTDIDTGEGVTKESGPLADILYASGAQYPFLPPLQIDGRWLVDGGFSSSLPILEAVKRQLDVIIALTFEDTSSSESSFIDFCLHFFGRSFRMSERSQTTLAVDLHHHEIIIAEVRFHDVINMWNVEKIPAILEAGARTVAETKAEILAAVSSFAPTGWRG